jgi:hypothetical protein
MKMQEHQNRKKNIKIQIFIDKDNNISWEKS